MPEYSEIYVLSSERSAKSVHRFLEHFLPARIECADEYVIPQYSDCPELIFKSDTELILYCEKFKEIEHTIYWHSANDTKPEHAMVSYLRDGNIVYNLATDAGDKNYVRHLLKALEKFLSSDLAYVGHEEPPNIENKADFIKQIDSHHASL